MITSHIKYLLWILKVLERTNWVFPLVLEVTFPWCFLLADSWIDLQKHIIKQNVSVSAVMEMPVCWD